MSAIESGSALSHVHVPEKGRQCVRKLFDRHVMDGLRKRGGVVFLTTGHRVYMSREMGQPVAFGRFGCVLTSDLYGAEIKEIVDPTGWGPNQHKDATVGTEGGVEN